MPRVRTLAGAIGATAAMASMTIVMPSLPSAGVAAPAGAATTPAVVPLTGSAAAFTSHVKPNGRVAASTRISIQVWLRPRTAAAAQFALAVSTPGSAQFHHYLRPSAYAGRFGPSRAEAAKVEAWLRTRGFTSIQADAQRSYVRATAPASDIERAFRVQLRLYPATARVNAGPYRLRANDRRGRAACRYRHRARGARAEAEADAALRRDGFRHRRRSGAAAAEMAAKG